MNNQTTIRELNTLLKVNDDDYLVFEEAGTNKTYKIKAKKVKDFLMANYVERLNVVNNRIKYQTKVPYYFQPLYSEYDVGNGYLKATGEWMTNTDYPQVYLMLLNIYRNLVSNETDFQVPTIQVKLNTETYDDFDFVINVENKTFRLPLTTGLESDYLETSSITILPDDIGIYTVPSNGMLVVSGQTAGPNSSTNHGGDRYSMARNPNAYIALQVQLPNESFITTQNRVATGTAYTLQFRQRLSLHNKFKIVMGYMDNVSVLFYKYKNYGDLYYYIGGLNGNSN